MLAVAGSARSCWSTSRPGPLRHHHVEHAQRGLRAAGERDRLGAVGGADDVVAVTFEAEADQVQDVLLVVGDEHGRGHGRSMTDAVDR